MRKLLLLTLLTPGVAFANVENIHTYVMAATGAYNQHFPLQANYEAIIKNDTDTKQHWHYVAKLTAQDHRSDIIAEDFYVAPHKSKTISQTIYKQVRYLAPGTYRLTGEFTVYSGKLGISKSDSQSTLIYVR